MYIVQRGFTMWISPVNILYFNQINLPYFCGTGIWTLGLIFARQALHHLSHSTSPKPPKYYSTALSVFPYAFFLQRCNVFQYYSLSIILFSSPILLVQSKSPLSSNVWYVYIYIYWSCLYLCIWLSFVSNFHLWKKTCDLCLFEHGLL
jgi:hypothetical protein